MTAPLDPSSRSARPEVLRAIRALLLEGASAPQVVRALEAQQQAGQLPAESIPSVRTVSNIAREMREDESSGRWSAAHASPESVGLLLLTLGEVVRRTQGHATSLGMDEAALIPTLHRALAPRLTKLGEGARAWQAYVWTRFYLSWVRDEHDAEDFALLLTFMQDHGKWPVTAYARAWPRAERVLDAATGWLPPDLLEVAK